MQLLKPLLSVVFAVIGLMQTALSQTAPTTMNFQGRLTRLNGKPLPDGQYVVTIRLWKDLTSTNSNDLLITWQSLSVQVRSGVFSTVLPNLTEAVLAGGVAYLEIEPAGQSSLSPRIPLLSVPYAVLAGTVFDGAITNAKLANHSVTADKVLDGSLTGSDLADNQIQARKLVSDKSSLEKVTGGIAFETDNAIWIQGNFNNGDLFGPLNIARAGATQNRVMVGYDVGDFGYIDVWKSLVGPANLVLNLSGGKVGVGKSTPDVALDVNGTVKGESNNSPGIRGITVNHIKGGVYGSGGYYGVYGDGGQYGIGGFSDSTNFGTGVQGIATAGSGQTRGGDFRCASPEGYGVLASNSKAGTALYAESAGGQAAAFSGDVYVTNGALKVNGNALKPGGGPWADLNSDRRLKTEIKPLENALDRFLALQGVSYRFKHPEELGERAGLRRGFIAQDVERHFPEWVITKPNGYKTISFDSGFDALTVEAIREQQHTIMKLQSENSQLRARLDRIERALLKRNLP